MRNFLLGMAVQAAATAVLTAAGIINPGAVQQLLAAVLFAAAAIIIGRR